MVIGARYFFDVNAIEATARVDRSDTTTPTRTLTVPIVPVRAGLLASTSHPALG